MVKQYLLLFFVLFNVGLLYAQTVNIPFSFTDGIDTIHNRRVGLDSTATDGIDPHLGESDLPPVPPMDWLEVRFDLFPFIGAYVSTYWDFRYAPSFPFTGIREHRLIWQVNSQSTTGLTIIYNLPDSVMAEIRNTGSTTLFSAYLTGTGSYTIPPEFELNRAKLIMHYGFYPPPDTTAAILITPPVLNFGTLTSGTTSTRTLQVKNIGSLHPLIISDCISTNIVYTVTPPSSYPVYIPANSTKNFYINVTVGTNADSGLIIFDHNAVGSQTQISVSHNIGILPDPITIPDFWGTFLVRSGSDQRFLWFGLDSTATDGIDQHLGEMEIPPPCPPGCFDTRFILPLSNFNAVHSMKDYRYALQPFVGQKEYRLYQQPSENENVVIYWYLPQGLTGYIRDIPFSDINVPIADTGSFVITQPNDYPRLRVLIDYDLEGITPVELTSFYAVLGNNSVILNWTTAAEANNLGFEIERASFSDIRLSGGTSPFQEWEKIGFVKGNGTTTIDHNYNFTDNDITEKKYSYRLKQIDFDGSFNYSTVIEVITSYIPAEYFLSDNYPNPFNPVTTIEFSLPEDVENVKLTIYDALGKKVAELVNGKLEAGRYRYQWDAGNTASGLYIYQLQTNKFTSSKKMLMLK